MGLGGLCGNSERTGASRGRARAPALAGLFVLLAVIALSACGGGKIEVERVASLPADAQKATFAVLPANGQDHAKDYPKFADQIAARLAPRGLSRVESPSQARYALMFFYNGDGRPEASADERWGRSERRADESKIERSVSILLYDLTRPERTDEKVFGGRARCFVDTSKHDPQVLSALIDALLQDFPGKSRETFSVSLPDIN
jgi:hypothetical protein